MSEVVSLSVTQQIKLAPFYNRHLSRRDEPRVRGGALDWANMKVETLSSNPLVLVVDDVFRPELWKVFFGSPEAPACGRT